MAFWLYQLSENVWSLSDYRFEMWENNSENWRVGRVSPGGSLVESGDIVVLYYAKANAVDCGIVGWGVALWYNKWMEHGKEVKELRFRLAPPSDYLKMSPLYNETIQNTVNQIRGANQGTMWMIEKNDMTTIRREITKVFNCSHN